MSVPGSMQQEMAAEVHENHLTGGSAVDPKYNVRINSRHGRVKQLQPMASLVSTRWKTACPQFTVPIRGRATTGNVNRVPLGLETIETTRYDWG